MFRLVTALALLIGLALPVVAEERSALWPKIPVGTGTPHPEGNAFMRKQHMDMMKHDRDLTMYEGERPVHASLAACFDCHAVKDDAGIPVTYTDEKHFCRVCHDFAAVKVDCFMCHRSTPDGVDEAPAHARAEPGTMLQLQAYLDGVRSDTGPLMTQSQEVKP